MQIIKVNSKYVNIIFEIGIWIHLLIMSVGYGEWSIPYQGRLLQIAFGLFAIKILMTYYSKKEWVILLAIGVLGVVSYLFTRDEYVLSVLVMIFAAKSTDMRQICKRILVVASIATMVIAVLSLFGVGGIPVDVRDYGRGGVESRWCFGFGHANNIHGTVWYLISLVVYVFHDKLNWKHYSGMTVLNIVLFYLTGSRGGFIAMQAVIVFAALLPYYDAIGRKSLGYILCACEIIGVTLLSIVSAMIPFEEHPILAIPDRLSTGRLHLAYWYADISKWNIFASGGELKAIDNGWVVMFFSYGYVIGALFVLFHLYLLYRIWKQRNGLLLAILMTSVFYTFMEATYMTNPTYLLSNLSYIVAMLLLSDKKEQENESGKLEN